MNRKTLYYILIALLFGIFVYFESLKPKSIDWSYNFSSTGKMPYGCSVLKDILPKTVGSKIIVNNYDNPFIWKNTCYNCSGRAYIIITNSFDIDSTAFEVLKNYAASGNKVFISAEWFNTDILDSFHIKLDYPQIINPVKNKKVSFHFTESNINDGKQYLFHMQSPSYFSGFDTTTTTVLARDKEKRAIFIKIPLSYGAIYLCTTPLAFTNYHLLYSNPEYAFKCLSFIQEPIITWDEYFKPEGVRVLESTSPIRYMLSKEPLRYAYYTLLITFILFLFFEGRRKQRMIPEYQRPKNTSLEFISTVSMLYFNKQKHKNLAEKRIAFLYDYISTHYYMRFDETDINSIKLLAEKSGASETQITRIYHYINWIRKQENISETEAMEFIELTNRFMNLNKKRKQS